MLQEASGVRSYLVASSLRLEDRLSQRPSLQLPHETARGAAPRGLRHQPSVGRLHGWATACAGGGCPAPRTQRRGAGVAPVLSQCQRGHVNGTPRPGAAPPPAPAADGSTPRGGEGAVGATTARRGTGWAGRRSLHERGAEATGSASGMDERTRARIGGGGGVQEIRLRIPCQ